ncbi:MAG: TolC family protein, partial [Planctomycetota bacterium]
DSRLHVRAVCTLMTWVWVLSCAPTLSAQWGHRHFEPEQRCIQVRPPEAIKTHGLRATPRPPTVTDEQDGREVRYLSLDEAIHVALQNADIIRVLAGDTAVSSGRSIYDPAIANTQIDQAEATFDPRYEGTQRLERIEVPFARPGPFIDAATTHMATSTGRLEQTKPWGATVGGGYRYLRDSPGVLLDPANRSFVDLTYEQPLLRGLGRRANLAPIVIARIDTERTYYQLKDSVQDLVSSVVTGYWGIVFARIDVWAREQQVEQLAEVYRNFQVQQQVGRTDAGDLAQSAVSLANFRATLIASKANLINQEEALRNLLGLPPGSPIRFVPSTPPVTRRLEFDWDELVVSAQQYRPDLIEGTLLLETDVQRVIRANNNALPQVNALASYQFRGLGGRDAAGAYASSTFGQYGDWNVGVTTSLPLTLRSSRAELRAAELTLARDRANLQQQFHAARHLIALSLRNLDQFYDQYEAFKRVRESSKINLEKQFAVFKFGAENATVLNLLQAVTDWGNAVSSEAQAISQYNAELANLDRQIGLLLERHDIAFDEAGYRSIGPCWPWKQDPCYARALPLTGNAPRYQDTQQPADDAFNLQRPVPTSTNNMGAEPLPSGRSLDALEDELPSVDELIERYLEELEEDTLPMPVLPEPATRLPPVEPPISPSQTPPEEEANELPPQPDPREVLPPLRLDRLRQRAPVTPAEPPA